MGAARRPWAAAEPEATARTVADMTRKRVESIEVDLESKLKATVGLPVIRPENRHHVGLVSETRPSLSDFRQGTSQ
jgi:hypothetical protein